MPREVPCEPAETDWSNSRNEAPRNDGKSVFKTKTVSTGIRHDKTRIFVASMC